MTWCQPTRCVMLGGQCRSRLLSVSGSVSPFSPRVGQGKYDLPTYTIPFKFNEVLIQRTPLPPPSLSAPTGARSIWKTNVCLASPPAIETRGRDCRRYYCQLVRLVGPQHWTLGRQRRRLHGYPGRHKPLLYVQLWAPDTVGGRTTVHDDAAISPSQNGSHVRASPPMFNGK